MSRSHSSSEDSNESRKRPNDEITDLDPNPKRPNRDLVTLKVLIPSIAAGAVIGKSGEAIVRLQKDTNTKVKVSKQDDFYPGTTERVCLIVGSIFNVMTVHNYIMDRIREKPDPNPHTVCEGQLDVERHKQVKILVPNSTAGLVIGRKGSSISQVKKETGAFIQVSQKSLEYNLAERCIIIAGDINQIRLAVHEVLKVIAGDPESDSCPNLSYADVEGPVASVYPTGSPYALPPQPSSQTTASQQHLVTPCDSLALMSSLLGHQHQLFGLDPMVAGMLSQLYSTSPQQSNLQQGQDLTSLATAAAIGQSALTGDDLLLAMSAGHHRAPPTPSSPSSLLTDPASSFSSTSQQLAGTGLYAAPPVTIRGHQRPVDSPSTSELASSGGLIDMSQQQSTLLPSSLRLALSDPVSYHSLAAASSHQQPMVSGIYQAPASSRNGSQPPLPPNCDIPALQRLYAVQQHRGAGDVDLSQIMQQQQSTAANSIFCSRVVFLPEPLVDLVCGTSNRWLTNVQAETGCLLQLSPTKPGNGQQQRLLIITGLPLRVQLAISLVNQRLATVNLATASARPSTSTTVTSPSSDAAGSSSTGHPK